MENISTQELEAAYEQLQSADDAQLLQLLQELEQNQPMLLAFARLGELDGMPPACAASMGRLTLLIYLAMRASAQNWPALPIGALLAQQARLSDICLQGGSVEDVLQACLREQGQAELLKLCCHMLDAELAGAGDNPFAGMMYLSAAAICACLATLPASAS